MQLGNAVKEVRKARHFGQRKLAGLSGLSSNFLNLLEKGDRGVSAENVERIAKELGIPPSFIYALADDTSDVVLGAIKTFIRKTLRVPS